MRSRYARWDGSQDPMRPRADVADLLDGLGDDLLMGVGGRAAIDALHQRGLPGQRGLDELRQATAARLRQAREEIDLDGPLADLARELEEVVALERAELARRADADARLAELELDTLPRDPVGRLTGLRSRALTSQEAASRLEALTERLRRDLLDASLGALTAALGSVRSEDLARIAAMLGALNQLLEARAANGGDPPADEPERFAAFVEEYRDLIPDLAEPDGRTRPPADLDELLAAFAQRSVAAQRFVAALSAEQREALQAIASTVFDDADLELELDRFGRNVEAAYPDGVPIGPATPGPPEPSGASGPISALVEAHARVAELEDLGAQLAGGYRGATLEDVDEDLLRRHLGEGAVRDVEGLRAVERDLERAGAVRVRDGELELTPRGARLLGERALTRLMARVQRHPARLAGGADPEPTGQTRPWAFGDREPLSARATVHNAVLRRAGRGPVGRAASDRAMPLDPEDLAVEEQEVRPRTATALLLDLSFSMPLQGHFLPAKRTALALHALIEGRHRQDSLHLIGFSDYARRMQPADLAAAGFERVYGTNMHHAFLLARRVLADDPRPVKRVVMVTDGEPTAHLVDGRAVFHWPPVPETLEATLREAMRLARAGIELDVFLLEDAPGLVAFAQRLADLTGGEVVRMDAEAVGRAVVAGYRSGVRRSGVRRAV